MAHSPTRIEPHSPTQLRLEWNNGERYAINYTELRYQCPCAVCVDEMTGARVIRREEVAADVRPTDVTPVGQYAIRFAWSDGHASGIFHFDTLYEISQGAGTRV